MAVSASMADETMAETIMESSQNTPVDDRLAHLQSQYAQLIIKSGVNLQPGQGLSVRAELEHAPFVRQLVAAAYQAGAKHVFVQWDDDPTTRARLLNVAADSVEYVPPFDVVRLQQMLDEGWARVSLVGPAHPTIMNDVPPAIMRRASAARSVATKFYSDATMTNRIPWCVAAVPTQAWAQQVFPELSAHDAVAQLWTTIFATARADQPDPQAAWLAHEHTLESVAAALIQLHVRSLHFVDATPGRDGKPATDLVVGLSEAPVWIGGSGHTPQDVRFQPNIPTEEIFTTPHNMHVEGWVSTSKPTFPFGRRVEGGWFRFSKGQVVEHHAEVGEEVLDEFFLIPGAQRLGEIALVDVRSPVNEAGRVFYEILFDENCVCHMAFGDAYPGGVVAGESMTADEREAVGINSSQTHVDFMIGTPTMDVTGITADGVRVPIMVQGRFVDALTTPQDQDNGTYSI